MLGSRLLAQLRVNILPRFVCLASWRLRVYVGLDVFLDMFSKVYTAHVLLTAQGTVVVIVIAVSVGGQIFKVQRAYRVEIQKQKRQRHK